MTDSSDATVMNPGKRRAGAAVGGPYHLHVGHRPEAGHVDVCFDFCHGTCRTPRGAGSGVARAVPLEGAGRLGAGGAGTLVASPGVFGAPLPPPAPEGPPLPASPQGFAASLT